MAYNKLSTANLPDPVIDPATGSSPGDYFNTVLYTGDDVDGRNITGVGFDPDFVWIKSRSLATSHLLNDVIRGGNATLFSEATYAETANNGGGYLSGFVTDGFSVTSGSSGDNAVNNTGSTYASWNWKANGSGVSNTDGDITSTVSANTDAGFSITLYTGDGTNGTRTVGHGLSQSPEFVIVKNRDVVQDWMVWTHDLPATENLRLNTTDAASTPSNRINSASSTTVELNADSGTKVNSLGDNFVMYCFHSVEGFSKIGSYVGNGSTDGPFVYTGFRPAFIMSKRTDSTGDWHMYDVKRDTYNYVHNAIWANYSSAEYDYGATQVWDILSNGFKARTSSVINNSSGATYIYMAFAEQPMKFSNAR
jgi:hypothetical protein